MPSLARNVLIPASAGAQRIQLFVLALMLGVVLLAPVDALAQMLLALCMLLALHLLGILARASNSTCSFTRIAVVVLGASISLRYLLWRAMYTLNIDDPLSLAGALLLFAAELYAVSVYLGSSLVSIVPMRRPQLELTDCDDPDLPTVDILVPTYNESPELLETTLRAALQQRYAAGRFRVYLLDDGGTAQKLQAEDPVAARAAAQRSQALKGLCEELGVHYLARKQNLDAKAGNLNAALKHTDGELIAILDADHAPTANFLARTVPWLQRDAGVFLVQTPHHLINADPVERNYFRAFSRMPSESDMFYGTVQRGLDFWNSAFFCGSAAVLRRSMIEEVGGIAGESVTEDAETSLRLHALGYRSVYLDEPLITGLSPETYQGFIAQRLRWAQGMTQILLLARPLQQAGLRWYQKLGYMNAIGFWFFPFARITFLLVPLLFLVFDLQIYKASLADIAAFTVPHVIATFTVAYFLHGRSRWPLVSELYELLQSLFILRGVIDVLRNPRSPGFNVTPKGESLSDATLSPLTRPFYWLLAAMLIGLVAGVDKLLSEPLARDLTLVVMIWHLFNLVLVLAALAVVVERPQTRAVPRISASDRVVLEDSGGLLLPAMLSDVSDGGCSARIDISRAGIRPGERLQLIALHAQGRGDAAAIRLPLESLQTVGADGRLHCHFNPGSEADRQAVIRFVRGDERRLIVARRRRQRPMTYGRALGMMISAIPAPLYLHGKLIVTRLLRKLLRREPRYA